MDKMKKLLCASIAAGLLAGALAAPAVAGKGKKQKVEGTILAPARHPDGCYTGLSRHYWSLTEHEGGVVGFTFDVDKATWNKPFKLEATGGAGIVDLDLTYYLGDFHSRDEFLADPAPAPPATAEFQTHEGPGEKGKVPKHSIKAVICIYASENGASAAVPFTYEAGAGVK
jgi:hypothetical protein